MARRLQRVNASGFLMLLCSALLLGCAAHPPSTASLAPSPQELSREQRMIRDGRAYFLQNQHKFAKTLPHLKILNRPSTLSYHIPPAEEPYWIVTVPVEYTCPPWLRCSGRRVGAAMRVYLRKDGTPYLL